MSDLSVLVDDVQNALDEQQINYIIDHTRPGRKIIKAGGQEYPQEIIIELRVKP